MLITTCRSCGARFRVTPQQLNMKQGQVRCGSCQAVFNGFEALERHPDDATNPKQPLEQLEDIQPLEDPPQDAPASQPAPLPEDPAQPVSEPEIPQPRQQRLLRPDLMIPPPPKRDPPARAWLFGVALMLVVLAAESLFAYRGPLAQRYPVTRPWIESACARAGCGVPWSRDEQMLRLEDSELLEVPGRPQEIALGARIRNLATVAQEYPHLELTLTDLTGQAAIRRVLRPTDYLGRPVSGAEVMAPGSDVAVQLRLETPRTKATGYELLLFYP